jgi:transposase
MRQQRTPSELGFTRYDKARLHKAINKVNDKRTFLRLKAVLLIAQGMNISAVAKLLDKSFQSVYYWLAAYLKQHRVEALCDSSRSGRPLSAQHITDKRILRELRRNPLLLGYHTTVWTVALLAHHLSTRYKCDIRPFTLCRRMKAMGLRCKRPRYVYPEKDPHRAQKKGRLSES